ncbi:hypothetical protein ACIQJT_39955 [Streptomyces sp. NPDC091972]|uniref:hypothetical protein n=1 Tax=Streptomyces sp. NPDC091972 TaxID=3366007 RepID=UPI00382C5BF8
MTPPATATALADWLLDRPLVTTGPHAGGVRGSVCGPDHDYVYPEIAGYYLTWLSFLEATGAPQAAQADAVRAGVIGRLARELAAERGPRTRRYLRPAAEPADEWRNHALFAFDLGMVHRGLAAALPAGPGAEQSDAWAPLARTAALLDRLRDRDGSWLACLPHPGAPAPPPRWSTTAGPHLLKVAGGVLALARGTETPSLTAAATATLHRHAPGLVAGLPAMSHPALYALEGLLQAELAGHHAYRGQLEESYALLLAHVADGVLPEYARQPDSRVRSDVIAQMLRVGCVLAAQDRLDTAGRHALPLLARRLTAMVSPLGALPFEDGGTRPAEPAEPAEPAVSRASAVAGHGNTWCAMFAHQALTFHDRVARGQPLPREWIRLLV